MEILTDDKTLGFQQLNEFAANPVLICVGMVSEGEMWGGWNLCVKEMQLAAERKRKVTIRSFRRVGTQVQACLLSTHSKLFP